MKKLKIILGLAITFSTIGLAVQSCVSAKVQEKSGSELWSENCGRCHNAPGSSVYNAEQWEVLGQHMRMRAHITAMEAQKITEFLQSSKK
jgi:cytochrome c553